jgi:hypothetical protein
MDESQGFDPSFKLKSGYIPWATRDHTWLEISVFRAQQARFRDIRSRQHLQTEYLSN